MRVLVVLVLLLVTACGQGDDPPVAQGTPLATAQPVPVTPSGDGGADGSDVTAFDSPPPHDDDPGALEPSEPYGLATVTVTDGATSVRIPVYVAATDEARRRGLMFREHLPDGTGMIFLFPGERTGGFWMRNTLIPLSIAFYGEDGDVRAVLDMDPCTADPCTVYDPGVSYVGAIEVNQGFFDEIGLDTSWTVELPEDLPTPS